MILIIALVLTFLTAGAVTALLLAIVTAPQRAVQQRLADLNGTQQAERAAAPASRDNFPTVTHLLASWGKLEPLQMGLLRAGILMKPSELVALVLLISALLGAGFWLWLHQLPLALLGAALPPIIAYLVVAGMRRARQRLFEQQLAEALMLMASSLRSGYSVLRSMQTVAEEMAPPIASEFGQVAAEVNLGLPLEDALRHLALRVPSYDLELMVTAVIVQVEVGGNLAAILETLASTIRERNRIRAEVSALTAEGRLSGVILIALPPAMALFMFFGNRSYLTPLVVTPIGHMLIISALVLQVIGVVVIKRMLEMDF